MLFKVLLLAVAVGVGNAQGSVDQQSVVVPATGKVTFTSPNYPNQYPNNANVIYNVNGPEGSGIQFDTEAFSLEGGMGSCSFDYVSFSETIDGESVTIGLPLCGTDGPTKLRSATNSVTVVFKSDSSVSNKGFQISAKVPYCAVGLNSCPKNETVCLSNSQYCDGEEHCPGGLDEQCPEGCGNPVIAPTIARFNNLITQLSRKTSPKIVGGTEATANSWPWQVAMLTSSGSQICGGSILNNEWIMTAAHCCRAYSNAGPNTYKVRIGAHDLGRSGEPSAKTLNLARLIVHPGYVAYPVAQNDFCLLKTAEPMIFSAEVSSVCLADETDGPVGQKCWVTGWGNTRATRATGFEEFIKQVQASEQGLLPKNVKVATRAGNTLRQVDVVVSDQTQCNVAYTDYITPQMICAEAPGKDSCQGDSGGPFVCQDKSGAFKLVGVVSWGRGCAQAGYPGVYARTSSALDWIANNIFS